jgi:hypothetical protein
MSEKANPSEYRIEQEDAAETGRNELTRMLSPLSETLENEDNAHEKLTTVETYLQSVARVKSENDDFDAEMVMAVARDSIKNATGGLLNKPDIDRLYEDAKKDHVEEDDTQAYTHAYLQDNVANISKIKNSDANKDSRYRFELESGTVVECVNEWKNPKAMTTLLDNRVEDDILLPEIDTEKYVQSMRQIVKQNATVKEVTGKRTRAGEELLERLSRREAVTNLNTAIVQSMAYLTDEGSDTLYVPNAVIKSVSEQHELNSQNELYYHLSGRGMLRGNSRQLSTDTDSAKFWLLDYTHAQVEVDDVHDEEQPMDEVPVGMEVRQ